MDGGMNGLIYGGGAGWEEGIDGGMEGWMDGGGLEWFRGVWRGLGKFRGI